MFWVAPTWELFMTAKDLLNRMDEVVRMDEPTESGLPLAKSGVSPDLALP